MTKSFRIFAALVFAMAFVNTVSFCDRPYVDTLYVLKFAIFLVVLVYGMLLATERSSSASLETANILMMLSSGWCGFLLTTVVWSRSPVGGLFTTLSYLALFVFAFWILPRVIRTEREQQELLNSVILGIACAFVLSAALSLKYGTTWYFNPHDGRLRFTFGLKNANQAGSHAFAVFSAVFSLRLLGRKRLTPLMPISALVLLLSDCRTAIVSTFLLVTLYYVLRFGQRLNPKARLTLVASLCLLTVSLLAILALGVGTVTSVAVKGLGSRWLMWQSIFTNVSFSERFIGAGMGGSVHLHNFFVNVFEAGGLISVVLAVLLVCAVWHVIGKVRMAKRRSFIRSLFLAWIAYSMTESIFVTAGNIASIYVWAEIGMSIEQTTVPARTATDST